MSIHLITCNRCQKTKKQHQINDYNGLCLECDQKQSNTKHTPGPWYCNTSGFVQAGKDASNFTETICQLNDGPYTKTTANERLANCQLMAASPDLLEAARAAMGVLVMDRVLQAGSLIVDSSEAINLLSKAIAKAEGQS